MGGTDPTYISAMEHFESMPHEQIYARTQQIDAAEVLDASIAWLESAAALTTTMPLTRSNADRVIDGTGWEGAAADAAFASTRAFADSIGELAAVFGEVGARLGGVAAAAEAVKLAVVAPGGSGPIGTIARLLEAAQVIDAQMAAEALRQEAVLAMNMIYKPAYSLAGTGVPALPAPPGSGQEMPTGQGRNGSTPGYTQPAAPQGDSTQGGSTPDAGGEATAPGSGTGETPTPSQAPAPTTTPNPEAPKPEPTPAPTSEAPAPPTSPPTHQNPGTSAAPTTEQSAPTTERPAPPAPASEQPVPPSEPSTPEPAPRTPAPASEQPAPPPTPEPAPQSPAPTSERSAPQPESPAPEPAPRSPAPEAPAPQQAPRAPEPHAGIVVPPVPSGPADPGGQPGVTGPIPETTAPHPQPVTPPPAAPLDLDQPGVIPPRR